jgi:hypothetical protein
VRSGQKRASAGSFEDPLILLRFCVVLLALASQGLSPPYVIHLSAEDNNEEPAKGELAPGGGKKPSLKGVQALVRWWIIS